MFQRHYCSNLGSQLNQLKGGRFAFLLHLCPKIWIFTNSWSEQTVILPCSCFNLISLTLRGRQYQQIVNCLFNIFLPFFGSSLIVQSLQLCWIAAFYPCLTGKPQKPSDFTSLFVFHPPLHSVKGFVFFYLGSCSCILQLIIRCQLFC